MKRTAINQTRRRLLGQIASTSALATLSSLGGLRAALAESESSQSFADNRSLVCIFLFGGNDSWNTLAPHRNVDYQRYQRNRGGLALARDSLLPLGDGQHAVHPALAGTRGLYRDGKLAFVRNVGNLIEPATRAEYLDSAVRLPGNLFSHNHQQEIWQTNRSPVSGASFPGWGGQIADAIGAVNGSADLPACFTLFGNNYWQVGKRERNQQPFDISPAGVGVFTHFNFDSWPPHEYSRSKQWTEILKVDRKNILEQQLAQLMLSTNSRLDAIREQLNQAPQIDTPFSQNNPLALQMRMVAKLISIREQLGLKRQIFMVGLGSFDTHGAQLAAHQTMLSRLDDALVSFQAATKELGVSDSVLSFTASEFGRTLTSNGDGTDHAWSSDYMVMGDAVRGGELHGRPIRLYAGDRTVQLPNNEVAYGPQDVGSGRFIPEYSVEQYAAPLARWMGLDENQIDRVFPNLANFESRGIRYLG